MQYETLQCLSATVLFRTARLVALGWRCAQVFSLTTSPVERAVPHSRTCAFVCVTFSFSFPASEPFIQIGMTSPETTKTAYRTKFCEKNTFSRHFLERRDVELHSWAAATLFRSVRNVPPSVRSFLCGTIKLKLCRPSHEGMHL